MTMTMPAFMPTTMEIDAAPALAGASGVSAPDIYSKFMMEAPNCEPSPAASRPSSKGSGPGGKHEQMRTYTPEEAQLVMELVEALKPQWTKIAKEISLATGYVRTSASVRNYYKRFLASKEIAAKGPPPGKQLNKCQMCGQIKRGHICKAGSLVITPAGSSPPAMLCAPVGAPLSSEPAEGLLALSSPRDGPLLPLAPASLQELETPGTTPGASPLSALSGGPFSPSMFALPLGSPVVVGPAPAVAPFARDARVFTAVAEGDEGEEAALARRDEAAALYVLAKSEVVQPAA